MRMSLVLPVPAAAPFDDAEPVPANAASRISDDLPALATASGRQLAVALEAAGFYVMRNPAPGEQFTQ
jgi:hypothetical protein